MNLALRQIPRNGGGAPEVDGMTVEEPPEYLKKRWPAIRVQFLEGSYRYRPQPILRKEIPRPGGGVRELGIPTLLSRLIQQVLMQFLQAEWYRTLSRFSLGFRRRHSANHAIACAQRISREGYDWVVDLDLDRFFDRVVHDVLMSCVRRRAEERRELKLIVNRSVPEVGSPDRGGVRAHERGRSGLATVCEPASRRAGSRAATTRPSIRLLRRRW